MLFKIATARRVWTGGEATRIQEPIPMEVDAITNGKRKEGTKKREIRKKQRERKGERKKIHSEQSTTEKQTTRNMNVPLSRKDWSCSGRWPKEERQEARKRGSNECGSIQYRIRISDLTSGHRDFFRNITNVFQMSSS